jgi:beta-lactamase regulating signal transducer with metallopeptidase domain
MLLLENSGIGRTAADPSASDDVATSRPGTQSDVHLLRLGDRGGWNLDANPWRLASAFKLPAAASVLLLALWVTGAGFRLFQIAHQLCKLRLLKQSSFPAPAQMQALFRSRRALLGLSRTAELRVSDRVRSPLAIGFFSPAILLPVDTSPAVDSIAAEQVIDHELAHLRRYDDWTNLVQQLIQAALFFHPAVWWVGQRLSIEREIACDDLVLERGWAPRKYARLLLDVASRLKGPPVFLASGISISKTQLQQRIAMILNSHRNISPRLAKARLSAVTSGAALTAVLALCLGPRLVLAQDNAPSETATKVRAADLGGSEIQLAGAQDVATDVTPADSGPKYKPGNDDQPRRPREPRPLVEPRPPRPPTEPPPPGATIEERLDRLERMVKTLMAQQNPKRLRTEISRDSQAERKMLNENENLLQDKRLAAEDAKRAAKDAQKAMKLDGVRQEPGGWQEGFQVQIKGLQKQREALQREMEKLQHQIERMQHAQERLQDKQQRHNQNDGEESEGREPKDSKSDKLE